jgi:hypothetical protein
MGKTKRIRPACRRSIKPNSFNIIPKVIIFALIILVPVRGLIGQEEKAQESGKTPPLVIVRIGSPVTLDGLSDEPAWNGIGPLPLKQRKPNFGEEPSEKTIVLIG